MSNSTFSNEETEPLTSRQLADGDLRTSPLAIEDRQAPGLDPYEQSTLTRNQLQVWVGQNLLPQAPIYNLAGALHLDGALDAGHFKKAFRVLARSSDALRMVVEEVDGIPTQKVLKKEPAETQFLDFSNQANGETRATDWMTERCQIPLDLSRALYDSALIKIAPRHFVWYLNLHHMIGDGWSFELIYRHTADLYRSAREGRLPRKIDLPAFADYHTYERAYRQSSRNQKAEAYWSEVLAKGGEVVNFYGRLPLGVTTRVRRISEELGTERTARLKAVAATLGGGTEASALFDVFAAVLVGYLYCLNGSESYTIGVPFHNRRGSFKRTIGFFSEVLPVQVTLAEDETLASLVKKFSAEVRRALRYGQHPVTNPIFKRLYEVSLNYHTRSFSEFAGIPARPEWVHNGHGDERLAIQIRNFGSSDGLVVDFDLHAGIFDEQDGARVVDHFFRVLDSFLFDSGQAVRRLTLTSPEEARRLLMEWNKPSTEQAIEPCVPRLFEEKAREQPDAVAVRQLDQELTYDELNRRANSLAHLLRARGVRAETPVAIYLSRSPEMIIAILGVLKAGGAYVPIDPQYSSEWLKFILEDTAAPILLTERKLRDLLPEVGRDVICLDEPSNFIGHAADLGLAVDGDDLAYVIYTSGSTGTPKGVAVTHRALANFTSEAARIFDLKCSDRVLQFASMGFDTSFEEIFPCLTRGAALVLRTDSALDSIPAFLQECRACGVTVLDLPTSYWRQFTMAIFAERWTLPDSLRLVIIGGEKATAETVALWKLGVAGAVRLLNTYGPTEATVAATVFDLTHAPVECGVAAEVPIGQPIANVQALVLDHNLNPVPAGVPGELYIGGVGLARGYFRQPDLTAEKFVPNPFDRGSGSRLYKTGDIVRHCDGGNLEFLRRSDEQVKVRGFRVELEGIAAVLRQHPLIRDAAVVQEAVSRAGRLVAYVVAPEAGVLNLADVQNFVRTRLPEYMVPTALVRLESLPLTGRGKVDRRALALLDDTGSDIQKDIVPPQSAIEERIADIWCELLSLKKIGRNQHFFELGGHSLLAAQAVARIRREWKVEIPLRAIFEAPTIASLAEFVERALELRPELVESSPAREASRNGQAPVSSSQARIWYMDQFAPESSAYNIAASIRITGAIDRQALQRSIEQLTERHESLRTTVRNVNGQPLQVIGAFPKIEFPEIDLTPIAEGLRVDEAKKILREEGSRPFDLSTGPLFRLLLLRLDNDDHVLLLNMHHVISDQWSLDIIAREISHFYNCFRNGTAPALKPLAAQYGDFAAWEEGWLTPARLQAAVAYWRRKLAGVQPSAFPNDQPRPPVQTFHGAHQSVILPTSLIDKLKKLARQENATLYMVFLALFKVLLSRYSGQEDVAIGSPVANRNRSEWEGVIGTFINILVLRTDLSGNPSLRQVIQRIRETVLDGFTHQEVPFQKLVEELVPGRDSSRAPLVQVLFNFQSTPVGKSFFDGISWAPFEIDQWAAQFDVSVTIDPEITRKIFLSYNRDLYDAKTISRILDQYERLLEAAAADADQSLATVSLLLVEEQGRREAESIDHQLSYPECCVHELFEIQVRETPDAVALVYEDQQLTYRELNERSNQLAARLRVLGVGGEKLVGIVLERSPELVIALLAVLKSGGAYVPMDPAYPPERIAFICKDSSIAALLSQRALLAFLPKNDVPILCLDEPVGAAGAQETESVEPLKDTDQLAYVIYTSGSTGVPKGVAISHRALVNFLSSMKQRPGLGAADILLSVTTISFDIAALELFLPLITGARVVVASREVAADGKRLIEQLANSGASVMQATPTTWRMLIEAGWEPERDFKIICGGEALSLNLARALASRSHSVWNLYGPTETTVWSAIWSVESNSERICIGKPIHNTQIHLLDSRGLPVPVGVPGELCIAGDGLARGYQSRPDLTAEKFVPNPFGPPSSRLYRTGDMGRYLADGNIEFIGRTDNQVKVRGFRIELGEIEAVLAAHQDVKQVVLVAREEGEDKRLVAYAVAHRGRSLTEKELIGYARQKLPSYMVPSVFVFLESVPLTPNGKIDRRALPAPQRALGSSEADDALSDRLEFELANIWKDLLQIDGIGLHDNFFDLGGNSLLAVRLLVRVEKSLGMTIRLVDFFANPTLEHVAALLRKEGILSKWSSLLPLQPHGSRPPFFWVHGDASNFLLPSYLGDNQPLYGFMHQGQNGERLRYTSVKTIASHYLAELCTVQPNGPYFLGGYSFGGLVAFEMAQQLAINGQQVSMLFLLDPTTPEAEGSAVIGSPVIIGNHENSAGRTYSVADVINLLSSWKNALYVMDRTNKKLRRLLRIGSMVKAVRRGAYKLIQACGRTIPPSLRRTYILDVYMRARRAYKPSMYAGPVVFFNTSANVGRHAVWQRLVHGVYEVHVVSGGHPELVEKPQLDEWAGKLQALLTERQASLARRKKEPTAVTV